MSSSAQHDQFHPRQPRLRRLALAAAAVAAMGGLTLGALPGIAAAQPQSRHTAAERSSRSAIAAPGAVAYVWGNKPSVTNYTPKRVNSFNSSGQRIHIHRSNTGKYQVTFFGLGSFAGQGTVDVTAEGLMPEQCNVVRWGPDSTGANLQVNVACWTVAGAPLDSPFMAAFTSGGSTTGTTDFVWANNPTAHTYTPAASFQFNSSGGTNTIQRLAAGQYEVFLPGPVVADGSVKVTAYGTNANFCQVGQWVAAPPGQNVFVDCFNTAGTPVNNRFTMTFTASDDLLGDGASFSGYLWGNDPTSSTYTPDAQYQFDTAGTSAIVTKLVPNPGEWQASWPNEADGDQGDQQGTAYGSTPAHCIIDGPIGINGNEAGDVFCFDTNGNLLDTLYTTQWMVG
jgi:hypothetical protein